MTSMSHHHDVGMNWLKAVVQQFAVNNTNCLLTVIPVLRLINFQLTDLWPLLLSWRNVVVRKDAGVPFYKSLTLPCPGGLSP